MPKPSNIAEIVAMEIKKQRESKRKERKSTIRNVSDNNKYMIDEEVIISRPERCSSSMIAVVDRISEALDKEKIQKKNTIKTKPSPLPKKQKVDGPKRMSAYILFSNIARENNKHKQWSFTESGREIGKLWHNLSEQEKDEFKQLASQWNSHIGL